MPIWTILDYLDADGGSPFANWVDGFSKDIQAAIDGRLLTMESLRAWQPKWVTKLADWDGLLELRITYKKVQYRPLAVYLPGQKLVLLCGAIEKGDEIPRRLLDTADRRRKQLLKDPSRVRPHKF